MKPMKKFALILCAAFLMGCSSDKIYPTAHFANIAYGRCIDNCMDTDVWNNDYQPQGDCLKACIEIPKTFYSCGK